MHGNGVRIISGRIVRIVLAWHGGWMYIVLVLFLIPIPIPMGVPTTTTTPPQHTGQEDPSPDTLRSIFSTIIMTSLIIIPILLVVTVFVVTRIRRG